MVLKKTCLGKFQDILTVLWNTEELAGTLVPLDVEAFYQTLKTATNSASVTHNNISFDTSFLMYRYLWHEFHAHARTLSYPYARQHWQVCFQQATPCWGAGGTQPDIPPRWNERSEPWPGEWGPGSCWDTQLDVTAPLSPGPAPATERDIFICISMCTTWPFNLYIQYIVIYTVNTIALL